MGIKISDFLPASQFGTMDARELLDTIGDYMRDQIAEVHTLNGGEYTCDVPTEIKQKAIDYANTLPVQKDTDYTSGSVTITITSYPKQEMLDALNTATTNFAKLLTALETTFDTTQGECIDNFNTANPSSPPPLMGPDLKPFVYVPLTFFNAIQAALDAGALPLLANAIEQFIDAQYTSIGTS